MWVDYKGVMALLEIGRNRSYVAIRKINDELAEKGYLVNKYKVPLKYLCERYGIDISEAKEVLAKNS